MIDVPGSKSSLSSLISDVGEMDLSRQIDDGGAMAAATCRFLASSLDKAVVSLLATTIAATPESAAARMALLLASQPLGVK